MGGFAPLSKRLLFISTTAMTGPMAFFAGGPMNPRLWSTTAMAPFAAFAAAFAPFALFPAHFAAN